MVEPAPGEGSVLDCGKHRGKTFRHVAERDPRYCQWVLGLRSPTDDLQRFAAWLRGRGYDARDVPRPGSGGGRSGSIAPWLLLRGLPQGGRVSADDDLAAYAHFVSLTGEERMARTALRCAVQSLVQRHVCGGATVKRVGAAAAGLDAADAPCELFLEHDEQPGASPPLTTLHMVLQLQGAPCEVLPSVGGQPVALRISAGPVRSGAGLREAFIRAGGSSEGGGERPFGAAVAAAVDAAGPCGAARRTCAICAASALRRMRVLPERAVLALVAAFLANRPKDTATCGVLFRDMLRFYAAFDWQQRAVQLGAPGSGADSVAEFPPKPAGAPVGEVCVLWRGTNLAAGAHAARVSGQLRYAGGLVQQCDACAAARRTPFLAHLINHADLWARYEELSAGQRRPPGDTTSAPPGGDDGDDAGLPLAHWTRFVPSRWSGGEPEGAMSLELAVTFIENIVDFLRDPANSGNAVALRTASAAVQSDAERCALSLTVLSHAIALHSAFSITGETAKRLQPFRDNLPLLAAGLSQHRDDPAMVVQRHRMREFGLDVVDAVCDVLAQHPPPLLDDAQGSPPRAAPG
eukprot:TRINITY_DN37337_c0_g1_i1.p1 TRINITY_DN37337_c0_g1~~TRINITY_DN37337_c0_g1_i1.p1  ORF type:complete len:577 (+),score=114.33 TRINITY_DN37337_c0_g1_i1:95-1825(+)